MNNDKKNRSTIAAALIAASTAGIGCKTCQDEITAANADIITKKSERGFASFHLAPHCRECRQARQRIEKRFAKKKVGEA